MRFRNSALVKCLPSPSPLIVPGDEHKGSIIPITLGYVYITSVASLEISWRSKPSQLLLLSVCQSPEIRQRSYFSCTKCTQASERFWQHTHGYGKLVILPNLGVLALFSHLTSTQRLSTRHTFHLILHLRMHAYCIRMNLPQASDWIS